MQLLRTGGDVRRVLESESDGLTRVIVSPKCKAVAPSCGQVFSWEFYSGTVTVRYQKVITDTTNTD